MHVQIAVVLKEDFDLELSVQICCKVDHIRIC